jgi:hypothetical protein
MFQTRESSRISIFGRHGRLIPSSLAVAAIAVLVVVGATHATVADIGSSRETRLTATDGSAGANFGWEVRMDGGTLIVSAPFDVAAENGPGAVYVFEQDDGDWVEQQKLLPDDMLSSVEYGRAIAIDGDWIAVGAPRDESVFVYHWDGTTWARHQRLPGLTGPGAFGEAVSIDGDTLVVGAPATRVNEQDTVGQAFVYRFDGSMWNMEQTLDASQPEPFTFFGNEVGVQDDSVFISAGGAEDRKGAVYVFTRTGRSWSQVQTLVPSEANRQFFGGALAVRGDLLVATARTLDLGLAAGFVFRRTGAVWAEEQKLTVAEAAAGFGTSSAVEGNTVLIGAQFDDERGLESGSVIFFQYDGERWNEGPKLTASDGVAMDFFGGSVAIDGAVIAVGAVGVDELGLDAGAAYVYDTANQPPMADAGDDEAAECSSFDGAVVRLDGSASSDPDSTPGTNDDIVRWEWFEDFELSGERFLGEGEVLDDVSLSLGRHVITLRVTDSAGESSTDDVVKRVVDTTAPDFSVAVSPTVLWPPNGRWVRITTSGRASDVCGETEVVLTSVEVYDGGVHTEAPSDVRAADAGSSDLSLKLRAKRTGWGKGRMYKINYAAEDPSGNRSTDKAEVRVPHDQGSREKGPKRNEKRR